MRIPTELLRDQFVGQGTQNRRKKNKVGYQRGRDYQRDEPTNLSGWQEAAKN